MHDSQKPKPNWNQIEQIKKEKENNSREIFHAIPIRIPARLNAEQTARLLGFSQHDIPILVAAKMLKPLGKPVANATKYFATCDIELYATSTKWLNEASEIITDYWRGKNDRKTANAPRTPQQEVALAA